jgi:hypothetical protein
MKDNMGDASGAHGWNSKWLESLKPHESCRVQWENNMESDFKETCLVVCLG